jgi:hypothetical protein
MDRVIPAMRTAQRKVQLIEEACAQIGNGPMDIDTWGEDDQTIAAYRAVGFLRSFLKIPVGRCGSSNSKRA